MWHWTLAFRMPSYGIALAPRVAKPPSDTRKAEKPFVACAAAERAAASERAPARMPCAPRLRREDGTRSRLGDFGRLVLAREPVAPALDGRDELRQVDLERV